jgi:paraquat-inducible protein B
VNAALARVVAFVAIGLVVLGAAVWSVAGGTWFTTTERVVMRFDGSVWGLQVGAPVVLRGVRIGHVAAVGLEPSEASAARSATSPVGRLRIPVHAEIEREAIAPLAAGGADPRALIEGLVAAGLVARLAPQSLLTGQLYVSLDLRAAGPGAAPAAAPGAAPAVVPKAGSGEPIEIPTAAGGFSALASQLETLDLAGLVTDLRAAAGAARQGLEGARLAETLAEFRLAAADLRSLAKRIDARIDPLAAQAGGTLADAGSAARGLAAAAERLGGAAARAEALLGPDAALAQAARAVQQAAAEFGRTAEGVRATLGPEAPLATQLQSSAEELTRAARAVRRLADTIEQEPESLLRGRAGEGR